MALGLVVSSSSCYSEIINGISPNAAGVGLTWGMNNVLPEQGGLVVNGVIYQYTTVKNTADDMVVNIRNKNAAGEGYIFDRKDDWSGIPQNTITRAVPVDNIPREAWGNGEIAVTGQGSVKDARVGYSYRFDTCYNPLNDPSCPGYAAAMADYLALMGLLNQKTEIKDPLEDENVKEVLDRKAELEEEKKQKKEKEEERKKIAKEAAESTLGNALAISQEALLAAMNNVPNFEVYYTSMPGGVYADAMGYKQTRVPENKKALRVGLAQQLLHEKMIDYQYKLVN